MLPDHPEESRAGGNTPDGWGCKGSTGQENDTERERLSNDTLFRGCKASVVLQKNVTPLLRWQQFPCPIMNDVQCNFAAGWFQWWVAVEVTAILTRRVWDALLMCVLFLEARLAFLGRYAHFSRELCQAGSGFLTATV